jgi:hypothetical protein
VGDALGDSRVMEADRFRIVKEWLRAAEAAERLNTAVRSRSVVKEGEVEEIEDERAAREGGTAPVKLHPGATR